MIEKAVQQIMLGTVCKTEAQTKETLRCIKQAGYDGIERIYDTPYTVYRADADQICRNAGRKRRQLSLERTSERSRTARSLSPRRSWLGPERSGRRHPGSK